MVKTFWQFYQLNGKGVQVALQQSVRYFCTLGGAISTLLHSSEVGKLYLYNWRVSETLSGVYKFELKRYVYIYYKYFTLPRGISINIAPEVGIFPEAEGRGKYSLPRVQYYRYSTRKG